MLADGMIRKDCIFRWNGDQCCCRCLVDLARGAILLGFGVLDFITDEPGESAHVLNMVER